MTHPTRHLYLPTYHPEFRKLSKSAPFEGIQRCKAVDTSHCCVMFTNRNASIVLVRYELPSERRIGV